jgi:hypothetical protein
MTKCVETPDPLAEIEKTVQKMIGKRKKFKKSLDKTEKNVYNKTE